ncbi:hypothetical protein LXL04_035428 [Taraxacum kok-saghyz]
MEPTFRSRLPSEFRLQSSLFTSPQATAPIRRCRRCEISTGVSASLFLNLNPTLPSADAARSPQLRSDAAECRRCETYHHSFFRLRSLFVAASQIESHRPPADSHNESPIVVPVFCETSPVVAADLHCRSSSLSLSLPIFIVVTVFCETSICFPVFLPVSGSRGSCFLLLTPWGSARPPSVSRLLVQVHLLVFWDYGLLFVFIRVVFVSNRHELKFVSCSCHVRVWPVSCSCLPNSCRVNSCLTRIHDTMTRIARSTWNTTVPFVF